MRTARDRPVVAPFDIGAKMGALSQQPVLPPVLSSPNAGTPTSTGSTGQAVTTDQGSGTLYWGVVTNAGSATNAQLKAGTGGNLVGTAGNHGALTVNAKGVQSPGTITGLTTATTYQILYLHTNPQSQDSAQASVSLTTA